MLGKKLTKPGRFGHAAKGVKESGLFKGTVGPVLAVKRHDDVDERALVFMGAANLRVDEPCHDGSAVVDVHVGVFVGIVEHVARHFGEAKLVVGELFALRNLAPHRVEVLLLREASALVSNELGKVLGDALVEPEVLAHRRVDVVEVVDGRSVQAQGRDYVHEFVHGGVEQLLFDAELGRHALARSKVAEVVQRRSIVF